MREKRWLLCFLVAMCCTFSAWALPSQDKTVTLKLHNVSIETLCSFKVTVLSCDGNAHALNVQHIATRKHSSHRFSLIN